MTAIKTSLASLLRKLADKLAPIPPAGTLRVVGGGGGPMEPP